MERGRMRLQEMKAVKRSAMKEVSEMRKRTAFLLLGVALLSGLGWVWTTHRPVMVAVGVVAVCVLLALAWLR